MSAPPVRQLTWISAHPAMGRFDRNGGETVLITKEDIKGAPSQAAVQQLQHWVNKPGDFHKQLMAMQKKSIAEDDGPGADTGSAPQVARIDEMLKLIRGSK